ncbi:MAG: hypothetical protein HRT68_01780 [Flavobacteriaceae bacterium]|nr:hypothetical protein [Flavobacteriaceae bacterium]
MHISELKEAIERNNPLDFGKIFEKSFELFKKVWATCLLHYLLQMVLVIPLFFVFYIGFVASMIAGEEGFFNEYFNEGRSVLVIVGFTLLLLIVIVIVNAIVVALNAGFLRIVKQKDYDLPEEENAFFYFFRSGMFMKSMVLSLAIIGVSILASSLCVIPIIYVIVPIYISYAVFAFNPDLSIRDILSVSFKLGTKKWLVSFGLIFVSSILSQIVGSLICGIGILVTASFVYLPVYYIYKDTIGFGENDEIEEIGDGSFTNNYTN